MCQEREPGKVLEVACQPVSHDQISRRESIAVAGSALIALLLAGCGGGSGTPSGQGSVGVGISPSSATLAPGGMQQFSASVSNATNKSVTWSVQEGAAGGSVTSAGLYTAPNAPGTYHVVATSQADTTKTAVAPAVVQSAGAQTRVIVDGATLAQGYNLGIDTSNHVFGWISTQNGAIECQYPSGQLWGVIYITVGPITSVIASRQTQDFSQFNNLLIDLKGGSGGESVSIGVKTATGPDTGLEPTYLASNLTTSWQTVSIPLSSLVNPPAYPQTRFSQLYIVLELVFGSVSETIFFRNVRYTT